MIPRRISVAGAFAGLLMVAVLAAGPFPAAPQDKNQDAAVKDRVEGKFKEQGLLLGNDIQVSVGNKTVTLSGTARNLFQKEDAGRAARSAAKGYKIVNDIALAAADVTSQQIAEGVMAAIDRSSSYYVFDYVGVGVTAGGVVTLKGWSSYPWSATEFVKLAQSQPGVQKVVNEIQRAVITDADRTLRLQVATLIYTRPSGAGFARQNGPVHILVNNGVVTLGGFVDKQADIDGFERLVRFNTGALNVVNGLQLRQK
ncbi:MAG: BON domain-containing protein [Candidatus Aminicenantales bacterium]